MGSTLVEKKLGTHTIRGFSAAGEETVITLPELNVAFDVGRAPREVVTIDHVCLSHGHMDHAAGIAYYFSQRNFQGTAAGCALVHHKLVSPLQDLLTVWGRIEGHVSPARIVGVDEDEDFELRRGLLVRPFRVKHPGTCLGFSVVEVRKKLKPEYANLSGQQLAALKRGGQNIENRLEIPLVSYCGDTAVGNFLDHDHVRNAEVLIVECTFYEPDHVSRARQGMHIHVIDLPELMERVRSPHVMLVHLTRRTGVGEVKRALQRLLSPADLARIEILMDLPRRPRRPDRQASPSGNDAAPPMER